MSTPWRSEKKRRPRNEVQPFVLQLVKELPPGNYWTILGSWRRMAPEIGDLDVMIVTETGEFGDFKFPASFTGQRHGARVVQGDYLLWNSYTELHDVIHMDFWACKPNEVGAFSMFMTGPKELNIAQRAQAQKLGYTLSQYGLLTSDGHQLDDGTEENIYFRMGMPFLKPEERQAFAGREVPADTPVKKVRVRSDSDATKFYYIEVRSYRPSPTEPEVRTYKCGVAPGPECLAFKYNRENPRTCKHIKRIQKGGE